MYDPFRNYDAWKTASPYNEDPDLDDETRLRCSCGAYLSNKPTRVVRREHLQDDYSPDKPRHAKNLRNLKQIDSPWEDGTRWWSYSYVIQTSVCIHECKRCGGKNEFGDW